MIAAYSVTLESHAKKSLLAQWKNKKDKTIEEVPIIWKMI